MAHQHTLHHVVPYNHVKEYQIVDKSDNKSEISTCSHSNLHSPLEYINLQTLMWDSVTFDMRCLEKILTYLLI